jgi:hypothetical protein
LGPFKECAALVYGTITYSWKRAADSLEHETVQFFTKVNVANENRFGARKPSSFQYRARLEACGENYRVTVPLSQEVKPGESDRFNIQLGAERSAIHRLRLTLVYNGDQELCAPSVILDMLVPRSGWKKQIGA